MEQETINPNIQKINIEIEGTVFVLTKIISWMKKASGILGFTYKINRI